MRDERHEDGKKEGEKESMNTSYILAHAWDTLPSPCSNTELRRVSHLVGVHPFWRQINFSLIITPSVYCMCYKSVKHTLGGKKPGLIMKQSNNQRFCQKAVIVLMSGLTLLKVKSITWVKCRGCMLP